MVRNITEIEKDYVDANMAIYIRFSVNKVLSYDVIVKAVARLLSKHPFLRSVIHHSEIRDQPHVKPEKYIERVEFIPNDERLFSFDLKEQLFKIIFCKRDFILIIHHAIADVAASLQVINDFLLDSPVVPLPTPLSIEEYIVKPTIAATQEYSEAFQKFLNAHKRAAPPLNHPELPYDQVVARLKTYEIGEDELKRLIQSAKKNEVSVHSLMTALAIKSIDVNGLICIATAIDLRKRMKQPIPEGLYSAPVGAFLFIEVEQSDSVVQIAKSYQNKLSQHINSADLLLHHYAILRGQLNPLEFNTSFFLSNAGQASFSPDVADKITDLSFSAKALLNCPFLACLTHQGKMAITVAYPDPWITLPCVEKMVHSFRS